MKVLSFPAQGYTLDEEKGSYEYNKAEDSVIGMLELIWTGIQRSPLKDLTKKDHKTNKALKNKIKEITCYKDKDQDSRVALTGPQTLILEEAELDLLKRHMDQPWASIASEDVCSVWEVIDSAQDYVVPKPVLVKEEVAPKEG